jgi:predicted phosphodiesterase
MRYAILADIHANLTALEAVLKDIEAKGGVDELWCLGDIVGYGPEPGECVRRLQERCSVCVAGNHDLGAIGKLDPAYFNPAAATVCRWTASRLGPAEAEYLAGLPLTVTAGDFFLVHGSPAEPVLEYISSSESRENFDFLRYYYCLVGLRSAAGVQTAGGDGTPSRLAHIGLVLGARR